MFGTECFFCGQMLGKSPVFFDWAMLFFVSMMVTVGFGPVDGGFLTGPNSKMGRVAAGNKSCLEHIFFCGKMLGKSPVFLTGLCIFFCEHDGDGGVWAC